MPRKIITPYKVSRTGVVISTAPPTSGLQTSDTTNGNAFYPLEDYVLSFRHTNATTTVTVTIVAGPAPDGLTYSAGRAFNVPPNSLFAVGNLNLKQFLQDDGTIYFNVPDALCYISLLSPRV